MATTPDNPPFPGSCLSSWAVATLNCRGSLRKRLQEVAPDARSALRSASIVCLQECRYNGLLLPDDREGLASLLGLTTLPDFSALLTKDAGIIIRIPGARIHHLAYDDFHFKWTYLCVSLPSSPDVPAITALHNPSLLSVFSIHGPFSASEWKPIATALKLHHPSSAIPCIIGADWNSIPDPLLDSFNARPTSIPWSIPAAAIDHLALTDTYRLLHPTAPDFTHYVVSRQGPSRQPTLISAKRLDSVLCSTTLAPYLRSAATYQTSSDHKAVLASFSCHDSTTPLPRPIPESWDDTWALHPGLWLSPDFQTAVSRIGDTYLPTHTLHHPSALSAWTIFHDEIRSRVRTLSISFGANQRQLMKAVGTTATALDRLDWSNPSAVHNLPELLHAYRSALLALEVATSLPFHSRLAASEMRHTSWLSASSAPSKRSPLPSLTYRGIVLDHAEAKLQGIWSFYTTLYTPPPLPSDFNQSCAQLLRCLRQQARPEDMKDLTKTFRQHEVHLALALANRRSSPGPDGLPYRLWIALSDVAVPLLTDLLNELAQGSTLMVIARSILLPKKGDLADLGNYRPISISDAHIRTIARVVAARLLKIGNNILPWQQAAFLPGRRTTMIAGILQGLVDQCCSRSTMAPPPFFVVSMDQQKAYDRVRPEWLFACLTALRLPPNIINVFRALYHAPSTRFHTAEGITHVIRFLCGVLQGDPSSCVIYNLTLQPFLDALQAANIGVTVPYMGQLTFLAFADDYLLFFEASPKGLADWERMLPILALYEHVSNARVNVHKSSFWLIGTPSDTNAPYANALHARISAYGLQTTDTATPHAHLGHPINGAMEPTFPSLTARCAAVRTRSLCFPTLGVSFLARIRRTKQFLTSRLWHTISVGPLPATFAKLYFDAIQPYIFAHTRPYVGRVHLTTPLSLGGFGLIDPDHMATSLSLSFLRRYLADASPLGDWIRAGLTSELRERYHLPPAALLLHNTKTISVLQSPDVRGSGFFGRLLYDLTQVALGLEPGWSKLPWQALITLPWTHVTTSLKLPDQSHTRYHRNGWMTWGDLLWISPPPSPDSPITSAIGPPTSRSVFKNGKLLPYAARLPGGVPSINWPALWTSLPPSVRNEFTAMHLACMDHPGGASSTQPASRESWFPISQDPTYLMFPWHLLTVGKTPLTKLTTAQARRHLQHQNVYVPNWPMPPGIQPDRFFKQVWKDTHECPLDEDMRSLTLLALGRNIWTYRVNDDTCPAGCTEPDSPTHGLVTCPQAQRLWSTCLPLLRALGCYEDPTFTPYEIVGAWPTIDYDYRHRLVLWRNAVLVTLSRLRTSAAAKSRRSGQPPNFRHCDLEDVLAMTATATFSTLSDAWAKILRTSNPRTRELFEDAWIAEASFVYLDNDILRAHPVAPPSSPIIDHVAHHLSQISMT